MPDYLAVNPEYSGEIIRNPGMGMVYVLRGARPIRFHEIDPDAWFLREKLTDKIEVSIPWCLLEPAEGKYNWNHDQWEGCFNSWKDAGYKVALKVRGMATRGTLYDDGTPQWVFDAGAKFIDENIASYCKTEEKKRRIPVYWDPVYLKKAANLINALGERYNGKDFVEFVQIAHMGQWGEMHVSDHSPLKPWLEAGFSLERYSEAHKFIIDEYLKAFPDTELSQALGEPIWGQTTFADIEDIVSYLVSKKIMLKFGGLGDNWHYRGVASDPFIDDELLEYFDAYYPTVRLYYENAGFLRPKNVMDSALAHHASYWGRGGESTGLGMPYETSPNNYIFRYVAANIGYRLWLKQIVYPGQVKQNEQITVHCKWKNMGSAPCYRDFNILLSLCDNKGNTLFTHQHTPSKPSSSIAWNKNCVVNEEIPFKISGIKNGDYMLCIGMQDAKKPERKIALAMKNDLGGCVYNIGGIKIN